MSTQSTPRPRFGKLSAAAEYSGLSRATLYLKAPQYPGLFKKNGAATIVDFEILDRILDALPIAKIKTPTSKTAT